MGYVIRMLQIGMSMDEGTVIKCAIEEGDHIKAGDVVVVVESEKTANEVEARDDGVLWQQSVSEGASVDPGAPIGILAGPDENLDRYASQIEEPAPARTERLKRTKGLLGGAVGTGGASTSGTYVRATTAARRRPVRGASTSNAWKEPARRALSPRRTSKLGSRLGPAPARVRQALT